MATHTSAIKRNRQALTHRERNRAVLSKLKTLVKRTEIAIENQGLEEAKKILQSTASAFSKAVKKGIIHKNNGARRISRLTIRVNNLAKTPGAPLAEAVEISKKTAKEKSKKRAASKKPKAKTATRKKKE
ncbi:MAG: 30S ribosomal protein S20 [Nitrospirae bacterium]|nr:30S ribosomal protein S20 [Nitrospirota bacterium]